MYATLTNADDSSVSWRPDPETDSWTLTCLGIGIIMHVTYSAMVKSFIKENIVKRKKI